MNNSSIKPSSSTSIPPGTEPIPWCAAFAVEALVIMLGNAVTIAIFSARKQKHKRSYYLMINLAAADLLVGALPLPLYIYYLGCEYAVWDSRWNTFLDVLLKVSDILLGFASLLTLTAISLERFYASSFPMTYRGIKVKAYVYTVASIWVLALATASSCVASTYLMSSFKTATYISMSLLSVLCLVICASYIRIWVGIRTRRRSFQHKAEEFDSKLAITLLIVTVSSLATWLPFVIVNFCYVFSPFNLKPDLLFASKLLHYGNSVLNPVIYSFRMPGFRKSAKNILSLSSKKPTSKNYSMPIANVTAGGNQSPSFSMEELKTVLEAEVSER